MYCGLLLATLCCWLHALFAEILVMIRRFYFAIVKGPRAPLPGDEEVSLLWIENELRKRSMIKQMDGKEMNVAKVELATMGHHRGLRAAISRINVTFEDKKNFDCGPTSSSFVLKRTRGGIKDNRQVVAGKVWREAQFYQSKLSTELKHMFPEVLYSYGSKAFAEVVLITRDVSHEAVPAYEVLEQASEAEAVTCVETLFKGAAEMHAKTWMDESLLQMEWLKGSQWYQGRGRGEWELAMERARCLWHRAKQMYGDTSSVYFDPKLVGIIDRSFEESSWSSLQDHLQNQQIPFMLCHGDFHGANQLVKRDSINGNTNTALLVDWSEVGPWEGTTDLAQMMISNVRSELFLRHGRSLVKKYWDRLIELGVDDQTYTFQQCWEAYCRGGCERWIWLFAVLAGSGYSPRMVQHFHDQLLAFIKGHGKKSYYIIKSVVCVA